MLLTRTTLPATEPISLAEAKLHLCVTEADEDSLINKLISAARMSCEYALRRTLITSGWTLKLDSFENMTLPMPNLIGVTSISYYDQDNVLQVINPADYRVDGIGGFGELTPVETWPGSYKRKDAVTIVYTAGYGAAVDVPAPIQQWLLLAVGDLYLYRERSNERPAVAQGFADSLLDPYKVWA